MTYNEDMKKVTTREFVRKFGSLKGETFIVMDRTTPIGTYTPWDGKAERMTKPEECMTKTHDIKSDEDKTTKPTVHEFCNLVGDQASNIRDLKMMVSEIENGKIKSDIEPEGAWYKEEEEEVEEEKNFVRCDLCKEGQAEKTFYDSGGAGEVEICRQCARTKYAGSMRTFDGYWKKLQDINLY